ncbi:uncharacterized protein EV420DRAFT_1652698 [Desarmillaria tabescens]|uniref:Uncharacterized protein n=1 Tax=Armillaria tabescens TaxID=1929756 RepID=A0AA39MJE7_ARMTA|nr:uncharacterized protein EV420DRAFT_1652698 [Desarmillaria tabescens]KAK0436068.1 hypothetical protein EV420DRAFT_1652698 [Desarmillaria tabescens]
MHPKEKDDIVAPSNDELLNDASLPGSASKVVPLLTPDEDPLPGILPSTKVVPPPSLTPDEDLLPDILPPTNFGLIPFPSSSIIPEFPGQLAPEIDLEALSHPSDAPVSMNWDFSASDDLATLLRSYEGSSVSNGNALSFSSPQGSSFSATDGLSLDAQTQSSSDELDRSSVWSDSFPWDSFDDILAGISPTDLSYSAYSPSQFDLNMPSMESASLSGFSTAPPSLPSFSLCHPDIR